MQMYQTFLNSIPKNRSEMVNELEIPDVTLSPYFWTELDESLSTKSESLLTSNTDEFELKTLSTDSSIPLSRAMTDSEIDYGRYRRYKNRSFSDPWDNMRAVLDRFPAGYLDSLNSFYTSSETTEELYTRDRLRRYNEELRLKMERFFDEECRVFTPDDPSLDVLEDALMDVDMKAIEAEIDSIVPCYNYTSEHIKNCYKL